MDSVSAAALLRAKEASESAIELAHGLVLEFQRACVSTRLAAIENGHETNGYSPGGEALLSETASDVARLASPVLLEWRQAYTEPVRLAIELAAADEEPVAFSGGGWVHATAHAACGHAIEQVERSATQNEPHKWLGGMRLPDLPELRARVKREWAKASRSAIDRDPLDNVSDEAAGVYQAIKKLCDSDNERRYFSRSVIAAKASVSEKTVSRHINKELKPERLVEVGSGGRGFRIAKRDTK